MNVYFLSGLGADSRAFKYLSLPAGVHPVYIDWLTPERNETLRDYASRIASGIDSSKPFVLVGLSFGGILATEVLEFVKPVRTILISSAACRRELPYYYRIAGMFRLNEFIPDSAASQANMLTHWLFGLTAGEDKAMLEEVLSSSNVKFSKWAINEILNWQRTVVPGNMIRIHGDDDRILPISGFTPKYLIKGGGHLLVVTKAKEVSEILRECLLD